MGCPVRQASALERRREGAVQIAWLYQGASRAREDIARRGPFPVVARPELLEALLPAPVQKRLEDRSRQGQGIVALVGLGSLADEEAPPADSAESSLDEQVAGVWVDVAPP